MVVLVLGAFDVLHWGHLKFLAEARLFGRVTVGLSSDELLTATKRHPVFTYEEREAALRAVGYKVVERAAQDATELFTQLRPKYFVCGNDWIDTTHLQDMGITKEFLDRFDLAVVYLSRSHSMSTSEIVQRIQEAV